MQQRRGAAQAPLQQVLQPSAKEELLGNRDEEKREEICAQCGQGRGPGCMKVQKAQAQPKEDCDRRVESRTRAARSSMSRRFSRRSNPTPSSCRTARKPKMPASSRSILPRAVSPAGHAGSNQRRSTASPSASRTRKSRQVPQLARIGVPGLAQEDRDRHGQQCIERQPVPAKNCEEMSRSAHRGRTAATGMPAETARGSFLIQRAASRGKERHTQHRHQRKESRDENFQAERWSADSS